MDLDVQKELWARASQGLAVETTLFCLLSELERSGILGTDAFTRLFDQADDTITATAMKLGQQAPPEYTSSALKIVEQMRSEFGLAKG